MGVYRLFIILLLCSIFYLIPSFPATAIKKRLAIEQVENENEKQIAEIKLKYHTNITHEIRTPLTLISAPLKELLNKNYTDEFLTERLQIMRNNTNRLLQLVSEFLDFRKVVTETYPLMISNNNICLLIENIKNNFDSLAREREIQFGFYDEINNPVCWFDTEIIQKVLYNLLSNAFKHTSGNGLIQIYAVETKGEITISVEDNGPGIDPVHQTRIFERFYQTPGSTGGTGIGLSLCKQLLKLHQGNIEVKSEPGKGSCFRFSIPVSKKSYKDECIYNTSSPIAQRVQSSFSDKPVILIVEDHEELRHFVKSVLSDDFLVIEAKNGEEGYNKALEYMPNLIVSDVMMPGINGYELTSKIRQNISTSHIPVILLTAKDSKESQLAGFTSGAEDYIIKPFDPDVLKMKIYSFIRLSSQTNEKRTSRPLLNEREQKFIEQFTFIVNENLDTCEFGIEQICLKIGVSRMQLYRKMQAILSKTPSQLIKEIRMQKAKELLETKGYNISETMNAVGYTSYSHFSNVYYEYYHAYPREVIKNKNSIIK